MLRRLLPLARAAAAASVVVAGVTVATSQAATEKRVNGIITSVSGTAVSISSVQGNKVVSGRVDAARTKVLVDGHPAQGTDLRVTDSAKAELGLDDVWVAIHADTVKSYGR